MSLARLDLRIETLVEASPERHQILHALVRLIDRRRSVVGTALVNALERVPVKSADGVRRLHRAGPSTGEPSPPTSPSRQATSLQTRARHGTARVLLYLSGACRLLDNDQDLVRPRVYEHARAEAYPATTAATVDPRSAQPPVPPGRPTPASTEFDPACLTNPLTSTLESIDGKRGSDCRTVS